MSDCDHGSNYRDDADNWHCLLCPHVWPVSEDPDGWGLRSLSVDEYMDKARRR